MRHQNKGIFNQNANLEWRFWATRATRFGGGKTKKSSRHDPKSLLTVSLARLIIHHPTCEVNCHHAQTRPHTQPTRTRLFVGRRSGTHTHTFIPSFFAKPAAPGSLIRALCRTASMRMEPSSGMDGQLMGQSTPPYGELSEPPPLAPAMPLRLPLDLVSFCRQLQNIVSRSLGTIEAIGHGLNEGGHGKGPWDHMTGQIKQAIIDGPDFSENYVDIDHQWSKHNDCEIQSVYWTRPMDTAN